jgi:hypothetical protein
LSPKEGLKVREYEIARPEDEQWWVDQCGFVISWFREMFKRVRSDDGKLAGGARVALGNLLFSGVKKLTALALDEGNIGAQWARRVLMGIDVWITKYRGKFGEGYEEERRELSVEMRNDLWEPKSALYRALHRELWLAQYYRGEIAWPEAQRYLLGVRPDVVPLEYGGVMKLAPLSEETFSEWEKKLWELVKPHNPGLLAVLAELYKRVEGHWSQYRTEFRQHLRRLIGLAGREGKEQGVK